MIIYTANFGNYDNDYPGADVKYSEVNDPYSGCRGLSPKIRAKMYKILNPDFHDIWIDSSIQIFDREGFEKLFMPYAINLFKHPFHNNLDQEISACATLGFINEELCRLQMNGLYNVQPQNVQVYYGGCFSMPADIRERWWSLICRYSDRDQLTLPKAIEGRQVNVIEVNPYSNPYFKVNSHK